MPILPTYPGVYIQEVPSGVRSITPVSTSVALFVGMADLGPMNTPLRTLSYTEFERTYGTSNVSGELHDQVKQFFLNGGSTAWIVRIAKGALPAKVKLKNEAGTAVLELAAYNYGTAGTNIRAKADYNTAEPESTFNLRVEQVETDGSGNITVVSSEQYNNVTMNPNSGQYVVSVLAQQSGLVRATALTPTALSAYSVWGVVESALGSSTQLEAAMTGVGPSGQFRISVDGSAFKTVTLTTPVGGMAGIEAAINSALAGTGSTVSVDQIDTGGGNWVWEIRSDADGGFITFASADSDDMAVAAQMGTANGGVDVGGHAHMRPAPSGLFGRLRIDTPATLYGYLDGWLTLGENLATLSIIDSVGTDALSATVPSPVMTSLSDLRTALDILAADVNANALRWTAAVHGYRLVLTPQSGGSSADHSAYATAHANVNGEYFWGNGTGNTAYYQLGSFGTTLGEFQDGTSAGNNGLTPDSTEYDAAYVIAERDIDLFNILVLPRAGAQDDAARALLWGAASAFARKRRAIVIVDPDSSWTSANDVVDPTTGISGLRAGVVLDHATTYFSRCRIAVPGGLKTVDPCGSLAGVMARIDVTRGVWKAPAGIEANLIGVRGVEHTMSDAENGLINPQAVNAIRVFPNGVVSWGARTMVGYDNSGNDDYKYLPVRRLALFIEESLYRGLKWAVFEPNDAPLWRQMRQTVLSFMNDLFRRGAFAGEKTSAAYFVKIDAETTTANDINLGIVNVVVGFAPLKPAEFVVITLQQQAGEVQT